MFPEGKGAEDNCGKNGGLIPTLPANVFLIGLAKKYDLIDFELGVKISGAGSLYIRVKEHNYKSYID